MTISPLKVFFNRKMASLLFLGIASGLPLFLTSRTLQAWMTLEKVDLKSIGLFSLVTLPYSLKFLWSPLLDRYIPPFLGRRRGWILLTQIGLTFAIALMALQQPRQSLQLIAINAFLIAFLSASQDIACDAYRTDILEGEEEEGAGASVWVLGYRIGLLIIGSLAFILADQIPWQGVYLCLAGLMALCIIPTFLAPEQKLKTRPPSTLAKAVVLPFKEFFRRKGWLQAGIILLFIIFYRFGDGLINNMATPFLIQTGFSQAYIGTIQGGMGLLATIVGALLGGVMVTQLGINRSLWVFGGLQALSNAAYWVLSLVGKDSTTMVLAINIENFCGGIATAGFVAFLMSLCNPRFSATQFALLSSLMAVSRDILVAPAGAIAQQTGWSLFFLLSIVASLPGFLLLPWFAPWNERVIPLPRPGLK
ncbi:AmpG family muropeptide MFS transporter [Gloeothece verrucosa]|uniref:Major facilitator superfamily MFS_1 n=1 Tax=Gloeothece verrucosa (strain PCC 7822) TaxID=497965 RepID=E0UC64_GLOV7|nr:AmpG family muropeptide MFS transporter [Gloeothece verrucosa]ADN16402.1 major facilitator superfamily MFS_1 [Gloeothece verrucosa PCC 7822]